ncbi:MAG: bifunctional demethylmenaquinone methyltransferase/2-methoxy-6-polyprenyl-1,4-benzoquinol methylase UbiE [Verrucomicrobiota bacterium]
MSTHANNSASSGPVIESSEVNRMFAGIAGKYDRANRFCSVGIDVYWRHRTVSRAKKEKPEIVIDLATGSGDIALLLRKKLTPETEVIGLDFCEEMLEEARKKNSRGSGLSFRHGDCLSLPLPDEFASVATIGFGLRNLEDRDAGLKEMYRVLQPGGSLLILEFSQPYRILRPLYYFYLNKVLPWIASKVTGNVDAYQYLGGTIGAFPDRDSLSTQIKAAGFESVKATPLTGGIVALHHARK